MLLVQLVRRVVQHVQALDVRRWHVRKVRREDGDVPRDWRIARQHGHARVAHRRPVAAKRRHLLKEGARGDEKLGVLVVREEVDEHSDTRRVTQVDGGDDALEHSGRIAAAVDSDHNPLRSLANPRVDARGHALVAARGARREARRERRGEARRV